MGKIHLILGGESVKVVHEMKRKLEAEDNAEVLKIALGLLKFYLDEKSNGNQVQIVREGIVYSIEAITDLRI